jgi:Holliday junction resolvase RusA-like endonuclease
MDLLRLTILGEPVGKGRPRVSTRNGVIRSYTPKKTRDWEKDAVALARKNPGIRLWRVARPDIDNVIKAVADAIQKAEIITNDSRICSVLGTSCYGATNEPPKVELILSRVVGAGP